MWRVQLRDNNDDEDDEDGDGSDGDDNSELQIPLRIHLVLRLHVPVSHSTAAGMQRTRRPLKSQSWSPKIAQWLVQPRR